jgi:hypothetical protein
MQRVQAIKRIPFTYPFIKGCCSNARGKKTLRADFSLPDKPADREEGGHIGHQKQPDVLGLSVGLIRLGDSDRSKGKPLAKGMTRRVVRCDESAFHAQKLTPRSPLKPVFSMVKFRAYRGGTLTEAGYQGWSS